jgi:TetR/AcrR family transcriptional regulator, regulator of cefoperazone and chloramphenicol sensitivity
MHRKDGLCRIPAPNRPRGGTLPKTFRTASKTAKLRAVANAGYQKGEETRQRILDAALEGFGAASFKAVTTRQIAQASGVSLPTLQYYFGDKEGLYRACAETIVERYRHHTSAVAAQAREFLSADSAAETARAYLKALIRALAGFLVGSKEAQRWAQFVARELRDPGPAFEVLYERLWRPGVEVTARLIARVLGTPESDPAARIQALLLISSLLAFQSGRSISLRTMHWSAIGPKELAMVLSSLDAQIDALGRRQILTGQGTARNRSRKR